MSGTRLFCGSLKISSKRKCCPDVFEEEVLKHLGVVLVNADRDGAGRVQIRRRTTFTASLRFCSFFSLESPRGVSPPPPALLRYRASRRRVPGASAAPSSHEGSSPHYSGVCRTLLHVDSLHTCGMRTAPRSYLQRPLDLRRPRRQQLSGADAGRRQGGAGARSPAGRGSRRQGPAAETTCGAGSSWIFEDDGGAAGVAARRGCPGWAGARGCCSARAARGSGRTARRAVARARLTCGREGQTAGWRPALPDTPRTAASRRPSVSGTNASSMSTGEAGADFDFLGLSSSPAVFSFCLLFPAELDMPPFRHWPRYWPWPWPWPFSWGLGGV